MGNPVVEPWKNTLGELAHPDAPRGGGGPGSGRIPRPVGTGVASNPASIPAPDSQAARYLPPNDLAERVTADADTPSADLEKEKEQANKNLAVYVVQTSEEMVGSPSVGNKECAALLDDVLKKSGGKSVNDYEPVNGRRDQDYKWGDLEPDQSKIRPGDLLQFRNFKTRYNTKKGGDTGFYEMVRGPQHSAIVVATNPDGTLEIVEQHVMDHQSNRLSEVIKRNHLDFKPRQFSLPDGSSVTVEVSGTMWVYHPVAKPKEKKVKVPR